MFSVQLSACCRGAAECQRMPKDWLQLGGWLLPKGCSILQGAFALKGLFALQGVLALQGRFAAPEGGVCF